MEKFRSYGTSPLNKSMRPWLLAMASLERKAMFEQFVTHLFNGTIIGSAYGLMGVGMTLIFGLMSVVNFAHGELYMLGAFLVFSLVTFLHLNYFISIVLGMGGIFILGAVLERLTIKPIRNAPVLMTALVTIGLSIFFKNTALVIWGGVPKKIVNPFPSASIELGFLYVTWPRVFTLVITILIIVVLHYFIKNAKVGKAMRATFENKDAAALMGIKIDRIYAYTFCIGSALAGIAGILLGTVYLVYPTMGELAVLKAFIVVIMGGMGNFIGAFFSGIILGISESLGAGFISTGYKDAIGFLIVILVLIFRPQGLFGEK
jgi:branched-chain amino acid transport system permease protein